jgi:hypothetical protein
LRGTYQFDACLSKPDTGFDRTNWVAGQDRHFLDGHMNVIAQVVRKLGILEADRQDGRAATGRPAIIWRRRNEVISRATSLDAGTKSR